MKCKHRNRKGILCGRPDDDLIHLIPYCRGFHKFEPAEPEAAPVAERITNLVADNGPRVDTRRFPPAHYFCGECGKTPEPCHHFSAQAVDTDTVPPSVHPAPGVACSCPLCCPIKYALNAALQGNAEGPTCHVCGAIMVRRGIIMNRKFMPTDYVCKSCGATTQATEARPISPGELLKKISRPIVREDPGPDVDYSADEDEGMCSHEASDDLYNDMGKRIDLGEAAAHKVEQLAVEPQKCPECKGTGKIATGSPQVPWRYCTTCKVVDRKWLLKHAEGEANTMGKKPEAGSTRPELCLAVMSGHQALPGDKNGNTLIRCQLLKGHEKDGSRCSNNPRPETPPAEQPIKLDPPTLRSILLWCGAQDPDEEFLQVGLKSMLSRWAASVQQEPLSAATDLQGTLIGNLLTRWELMTNDFKSVVDEQERNFYDHGEIFVVCTQGDCPSGIYKPKEIADFSAFFTALPEATNLRSVAEEIAKGFPGTDADHERWEAWIYSVFHSHRMVT